LAQQVLRLSAMTEVVSAAVRELLRERVQALEQLAILVLLQREPQRSWSLEEISLQLQLSAVLVEAALVHLIHHRFVARQGAGYRYAPQDARLAATVDELARSYDGARVELLALISSDAVGRVRRRVRQLMDRLKK
jgi:hypothetical protein